MSRVDYTPQDAFDISTRGIIAQGGFAVRGESCRYRMSDGKKCAAGQLIPDEHYDPKIEGYAIDRAPGIDLRPADLIMELQDAHDFNASSANWEGWKSMLIRVAQEHKLDPAVLQEIPT